MKHAVRLMQAPAQMSPGNYVGAAYGNQTEPAVSSLEVEATRNGNAWEIRMQWRNVFPHDSLQGGTDRFVDAAAILVPGHEQSQWMTMGSPDAPVEGALWRPDRAEILRIRAEGLGTVERLPPAPTWRLQHHHQDGITTLHWLFPQWEALSRFGRCGFAVWTGAQRQRGGVKSVSTEWVALT